MMWYMHLTCYLIQYKCVFHEFTSIDDFHSHLDYILTQKIDNVCFHQFTHCFKKGLNVSS